MNVQRIVVLFLAATVTSLCAESGSEPLFNGRDLAGWVNVNCAPSTWSVRDGMIISTGVPTGVMRTTRHYENFILELEWRHMKAGGNAGVFVWSDPVTSRGVPFTRSIEVQVLDGRNGDYYTSHGDVFAIHGAKLTPDRPHPNGAMRCLPSEWRAKPWPEWNHYRILCSNGVVQLAVNGKVVSGGSNCVPRKGYICLESEGSEAHFKNIRVRELPSSNPPRDEVAGEDEQFHSLYTGLDLSGWKVEPGQGDHWRAKDWTLVCDGKSGASELWLEKQYQDFVLIVDQRVAKGSGGSTAWPVKIDGVELPAFKGKVEDGEWNRFLITVKDDRFSADLNGQNLLKNEMLESSGGPRRIALNQVGRETQFANIYIKEIK